MLNISACLFRLILFYWSSWRGTGVQMSVTCYMLLVCLQIWEPAFTKELCPLLIHLVR